MGEKKGQKERLISTAILGVMEHVIAHVIVQVMGVIDRRQDGGLVGRRRCVWK